MDNKEFSAYYKLGYKAGFKTSVLFLMKHCDDATLINKLIEEYHKQPMIDEIVI